MCVCIFHFFACETQKFCTFIFSLSVPHGPDIMLQLQNAAAMMTVAVVVAIMKVDRVVWTDSEAEASICRLVG